MATETEITVEAPILRCWAAWADPNELAQWLPDSAHGRAVRGDQLHFRWDGLDVDLDLDVIAAVPCDRLVLRGHVPNAPPQLQEVRFAAFGERTKVRLKHSGFSEDAHGLDQRDGTASGWTLSLQLFKAYVERYFGRSRRSAWLLGAAVASHERVFAQFTEAARVKRWLGPRASIASHLGGPCRLPLEGDELTGELVARVPPRELAIHFDSIDTAMCLRQLPIAPGAAVVGVQLASWSTTDVIAPLRSRLRAAVDELVVALRTTAATA